MGNIQNPRHFRTGGKRSVHFLEPFQKPVNALFKGILNAAVVWGRMPSLSNGWSALNQTKKRDEDGETGSAAKSQRPSIVGFGRTHRGGHLRRRRQNPARTRAGGRIRRIPPISQSRAEYPDCATGFGSASGRRLLRFRQTATRFSSKLAGIAR